MMIRTGLKRATFYGLGLCLLLLVGWSQSNHVQAAAFGSGPYGVCAYQTGCPPPPSQVTLPSGLQVSINLTDGQIIPYSGYTIIVTPLNGKGTSFQEVAFYINGNLAATVTPDETGTAHWFWNPGRIYGTDVKVIVTGTDGSTVTKEYHVRIGPAPTSSAPSYLFLPPAASKVVQHVVNALKQTIRHLPRPVAYSFPYILLILLGVNVILLVLQLQHELHEYHILQALLERNRMITNAKQEFVSLIGHYLRTPLAVISGGIDLISKDAVVSSDMVDLQAIAKRMRDKIEALMHQTGSIINLPTAEPGGLRKQYFWQHVRLFVPLVLIAVVVIPFDYLLAHAGSFSHHQVNFTAQAIIFVALALVSYQVFRRVALHRKQKSAIQQLLSQEEAVNQARDQVISSTVAALVVDLQGIDNLAGRLGTSPANTFINRGRTDFHSILAKFAIAERLHGGSMSGPFAMVKLSDLITQASGSLSQQLHDRGVTTQLTTDGELAIQNQQLLVFVLNTILDNAVAYSSQGGGIEIGLQHTADASVITITDHGEGISQDKQSRLFQAFTKGEGSETFTHAGMGFSLYLDKLVMTYLGGSIALESEVGHGTRVILHLPNPPKDQSPPASASPSSNVTVM
ncbi:MAG TPA: ATP-binding protein [Candidatus Saccharimonadales bacterium]|nr:ATP-binding protein [Candidatus Saccharimonadales bacterium]